MQKSIAVEPLSKVALMLAPFHKDTQLGTATGFVVKIENMSFLVTNLHVFIGNTRQGIPDHVRTKLRIFQSKEFCIVEKFPLYDSEEQPLWLEHPVHGSKVDVALLPLRQFSNDIEPQPLDLSLMHTDMELVLTEAVTVIGFPFGKDQGGLLPIWVGGTLASDLEVHWNDLPAFLISGTTKPSMSGSMVIARRIGSVRTKEANLFNGKINDKFLGVYSGRLKIDGYEEDGIDSHIGIVWRAEIVKEILEHAIKTMKEKSDPRLNPKQTESV